jgi:hypothetical protein
MVTWSIVLQRLAQTCLVQLLRWPMRDLHSGWLTSISVNRDLIRVIISLSKCSGDFDVKLHFIQQLANPYNRFAKNLSCEYMVLVYWVWSRMHDFACKIFQIFPGFYIRRRGRSLDPQSQLWHGLRHLRLTTWITIDYSWISMWCRLDLGLKSPISLGPNGLFIRTTKPLPVSVRRYYKRDTTWSQDQRWHVTCRDTTSSVDSCWGY